MKIPGWSGKAEGNQPVAGVTGEVCIPVPVFTALQFPSSLHFCHPITNVSIQLLNFEGESDCLSLWLPGLSAGAVVEGE
jgi:hypothetical protein